jgi:hypothetical protein
LRRRSPASIYEDALKGSTKTAAFLFNRCKRAETQPNDMSEEDREALEAWVRRFEAWPRNNKDKP